MGGSELGWQIPVDLEADTDFNERRGCPGHSSFSLAFPGTSNLDRARPPRKPRHHWGVEHRRLRLIILHKPAGLPRICRTAYHGGESPIDGWRPGSSCQVIAFRGIPCSIEGTRRVPDIRERGAIICVVSVFLCVCAQWGKKDITGSATIGGIRTFT
jgi:hypothetical protein